MKQKTFDWKKLDLCEVVFRLYLLAVFALPLSAELSGTLLLVALLTAGTEKITSKKTRGTVIRLEKKAKILLLFLLGMAAFSLLFSLNRAAAGYNFVYVVGKYCAFFWLTITYATDERKLKQVLQSCLLASCAVIAYGLYQYFMGMAVIDPEWVDEAKFSGIKQRVYATLINPNLLGSYLVGVSAFALGFLSLATIDLKLKKFMAVILAAALLCLTVTFSRGNWLGACIVLLAAALFYQRRFLLVLFGAGAVLVLLSPAIFLDRGISIISGSDTSIDLRYAYLESTLAIIADHPWGVGWDSYMYVFPDYDFYLHDASVIMYHCHNLFLNVAAELGLQGLAVFLVLLFYLAGKARLLAGRQQAPVIKGFARGYLLYLLGVTVTGMTDHALFNAQLGSLFWLMTAVLLAYFSLKNPVFTDKT